MPKVSVSFTQKVSEQPYETADYSLIIEQEFDELTDPIAVAKDLFAQVKSEVLKQAGCEYDLTQDGLVMRRLETGVRPVAVPAQPTPQQRPVVARRHQVPLCPLPRHPQLPPLPQGTAGE